MNPNVVKIFKISGKIKRQTAFPPSSIHRQKFRLKFINRKTRLKRLKKGEKQTRPKSRHLIGKKLFKMIG